MFRDNGWEVLIIYDELVLLLEIIYNVKIKVDLIDLKLNVVMIKLFVWS